MTINYNQKVSINKYLYDFVNKCIILIKLNNIILSSRLLNKLIQNKTLISLTSKQFFKKYRKYPNRIEKLIHYNLFWFLLFSLL